MKPDYIKPTLKTFAGLKSTQNEKYGTTRTRWSSELMLSRTAYAEPTAEGEAWLRWKIFCPNEKAT